MPFNPKKESKTKRKKRKKKKNTCAIIYYFMNAFVVAIGSVLSCTFPSPVLIGTSLYGLLTEDRK